MTTEYAARYTNTVLYDDAGQKHLGDFLIHDNGAWSVSNGDEDVRQVIDGSDKLLTRSLQNRHTHLAMQPNVHHCQVGQIQVLSYLVSG